MKDAMICYHFGRELTRSATGRRVDRMFDLGGGSLRAVISHSQTPIGEMLSSQAASTILYKHPWFSIALLRILGRVMV